MKSLLAVLGGIVLTAQWALAKPPISQCVAECDPGYHAECVPDVGPTPTPTRTPTRTPTVGPTATPTAISSPTPTRTPTRVPTAMPTPVPTEEPTGADFTLTPQSLSFPETVVGDQSSVQSVRVNTVTGGYALTVNVIGTYKLTQTCMANAGWNGVLAPNSGCDIKAVFEPTATGSAPGTITVEAGGIRQNVALSGTGTTVVPLPTAAPTVAPPTPGPTAAPTVAPTAAPVPTPPSGANMPIPPQATVDTTLPVPTGVVRTVAAGGNLQAALDAAQPGDVVELEANATWTGKFVLKPKTGTAKIWVRSSRYAELPPKGTRVGPADAGKMAKIVSPNQDYALLFELTASNYHLTGLEVAAANTSDVTPMYGLIALGYTTDGQWATSLSQLSKNIVLDRMIVHGTPTGNCRRGVMFNSYSTAVVDSYFYDLHEKGSDSQAIAGWNGPGPFLIENNYLEGAGENVMFGGSDTSIANLTPSDIVIRKNHFKKPASWQSSSWVVKNHLELKHAQRVVIDGNVFDTMWPAGQQHYIVLTVRNQNGGNPWAVVQDVSFTNNKLINPIMVGGNGPRGINFLPYDSTFPSGSKRSQRMLVDNNLLAIYPGDSFQTIGGVIDLVIRHNTADVGGIATLSGSPKNERFIYRDNLTGTGTYGVYGDAVGCCAAGLNAYIQPGGTYTSNEMWGPWPTSGGATTGSYSGGYPGNFYPANKAAVVDSNYRQTAAVHNGSDGKKIGADIDQLNAATAGVVK